MKPQHRPGTRAHRQATYKAMCAYQEGASIETAAQLHNINARTLRHAIERHGFLKTTHKPSPNTTTIPDAILSLHPKLSPQEIADTYGVSRQAVRLRLKLTGSYTPLPRGATPKAQWAASLRNRDQVVKAVDLRNRGLSYGQIGVRLNAPRSTVQTWIVKYHKREYLWQNAEVPKWWTEAA